MADPIRAAPRRRSNRVRHPRDAAGGRGPLAAAERPQPGRPAAAVSWDTGGAVGAGAIGPSPETTSLNRTGAICSADLRCRLQRNQGLLGGPAPRQWVCRWSTLCGHFCGYAVRAPVSMLAEESRLPHPPLPSHYHTGLSMTVGHAIDGLRGDKRSLSPTRHCRRVCISRFEAARRRDGVVRRPNFPGAPDTLSLAAAAQRCPVVHPTPPPPVCDSSPGRVVERRTANPRAPRVGRLM